MANNALEINNLYVSLFNTKLVSFPILQDISFSLKKGKILGLCGESGSGKSMCAYSIMRLLPKNISVKQGDIIFNDKNICNLPERDIRSMRGDRICMIFQDPMSALNPLLTIGYQLTEVCLLHKKEYPVGFNKNNKALELLDICGIKNPTQCMKQYPHELSGGMRQRVMIAMALMSNPDILIADEPTTALDPLIQKQILDLIKKVSNDFGTSVLFISHDMNVISYLCDEVCIMYGGRLCERGSTVDVFNSPRHCYTKAFLKSMPVFSGNKKTRLLTISGNVPMPGNNITGCPFASRCKQKRKECCKAFPPYILVNNNRITKTSHIVACYCI